MNFIPPEFAGVPDFTIISSDNIRFPVHKEFLATFSICFRNMLVVGSGNSECKFSEPAQQLNLLLPFLYPIRFPELKRWTLEHIEQALQMARKYEVPRMDELVAASLDDREDLQQKAPLHVFVLASEYGRTQLKRTLYTKINLHSLHLNPAFTARLHPQDVLDIGQNQLAKFNKKVHTWMQKHHIQMDSRPYNKCSGLNGNHTCTYCFNMGFLYY